VQIPFPTLNPAIGAPLHTLFAGASLYRPVRFPKSARHGNGLDHDSVGDAIGIVIERGQAAIRAATANFPICNR
jgi:hypothetical protein